MEPNSQGMLCGGEICHSVQKVEGNSERGAGNKAGYHV